MEQFKIDMAQFISISSLSFHTYLATSGVKLPLVYDRSTLTRLRENTRGGISVARKRYSEPSSDYRTMVFDVSSISLFYLKEK